MERPIRDALLAGLGTVAVHAAFVLLAPRLAVAPEPTPQAPLELVFLLPPAPPHPAVAPARRPRNDVRPGAPRGRTRPVASAPGPDPTPPPAFDPAALPGRPLSAVYLQQARQWSDRQAPAIGATHDPLADRTPPVEPDGRFRMRRAKSIAGAVAAVGKLFGGAGYTTDDCERMSESITGLMVAGDTRGAQEAIDYERRYCRP